MGETYWPKDAQTLTLHTNEFYAQTFTPLWSHDLDKIRIFLRYTGTFTEVKVSIQICKPDGTPAGDDISAFTFQWEHLPWGRYTSTRQRKIPPVRLVRGIQYALVIEPIGLHHVPRTSTLYMPSPSGYPRGKLIKSIDSGVTWDTTDLGDLLFAEYGDPPLVLNPFSSPLPHIAVTEISQNDFLSSACIRVATTDPCFLRIHVTKQKPTSIESYRPTRGAEILCLEHYTFNTHYYVDQKEKWDSLYHTFYIGGLKKDEKYWLTFTSTVDFIAGVSRSPIFDRIHPEAPPFTTIRRPDAPGDDRRLAKWGSAPCPSNYCYVMESTPDEWETCVYNPFPFTKWWWDLYNIPNLLPYDDAPIEQVHLTGRFAYKSGYSYASGAYLIIKTHGNIYRSNRFSYLSTSFSNRHWHIYENPYTGLPWTKAEVDELQIGIRLYCYEGVGWVTETWCTQLYCKIYHKCEAYN